MLSVPWFVYFIVAGILISAYMVIKTTREDRKLEESFIEQEGLEYIERMNHERETRNKVNKAEPM